MATAIVNVLASRELGSPVVKFGVHVPVRVYDSPCGSYRKYKHPVTRRWVFRFCETPAQSGKGYSVTI